MSWLDKNFRYTPSAKQGDGYLKRRFQQIRADLKDKAEQEARNTAEAQAKVQKIKRTG